jgi:hypothetical protein
MTKELFRNHPPTGLGLECFGLIGANAVRSRQQIDTTVNDCHYRKVDLAGDTSDGAIAAFDA